MFATAGEAENQVWDPVQVECLCYREGIGVEKSSVVVIGNFDGVHIGHQQVIRAAALQCDRLADALPSRPNVVVITFEPHPASVTSRTGAPKLLMSLQERIEALKAAGADEIRVVQFTADVAEWSPEEFVAKVVLPLNPLTVVVGTNFRFGKGACGDVSTLRKLGREVFDVQPMQIVQMHKQNTCSTLIRALISAGDVESAAEHLGRPFRYRGVVVMGDQRGRHLGFPTANLTVPSSMAVPADGVYAGWVRRLDIGGQPMWPAAISVGTNPTFDGVEKRVESYVLDRTDLELYGAEIEVTFVSRLRGQIRFDGVEALVAQMTKDVALTREKLGLEA